MKSKSWFLKSGLIAAMLIMVWQAGVVAKSEGINGLQSYKKWERTGLYPKSAVRLGHILETYAEPHWLVKAREKLLADPLFIGLVLAWGWYTVYTLKPEEGKTTKWKRFDPGMFAGPIVGLIMFTVALDKIPPAVYVDEAVTAYNTFSVVTTGRDEYGQAMPLMFKYFGSWLPGLNLYFLAWPVKVFGLTETVIRWPAAILGVMMCLVIYAVIKLKTGKGETAMWGSVFMAVTPWMVFNARLAYEEMLGMVLFSTGSALLWRGLKKPDNLIWGVLALSLASYDAHVFRYLMGIMLPVYAVMYRSEILKMPGRIKLQTLAILVITQIPNLLVAATPAFWVKQVIYQGASAGKVFGDFAGQLTTYLSPVTLFGRVPDIDLQHIVPESGLFYWWMIVPAVLGMWLWIRNHNVNKWWIAMAAMCIVPASLSGTFISVQRALPLLFPASLMLAEGMGAILPEKKRLRGVMLAGLLVYSCILLFRAYFVLLPGLLQKTWNYGYKELSAAIEIDTKAHWVIDNSRNTRNYILPLFYLKYPPAEAQRYLSGEINGEYYYSGKTQDNHKFARMEFRAIDWRTDSCKRLMLAGDNLTISDEQAAEHKLTAMGEVKSKTGEVLLKWYKTNPESKCGRVK